MTSVASKLQELNQNSLVEPSVLLAAQKRWEQKERQRRLQQYSDALFVLIYAQIRPLLNEILKTLFEAQKEEEMRVSLWSFYAHMPAKTSFFQGSTALSYEMGIDWYVNVRYENLSAARVPMRVMDLLQNTDVLARLSALFGSNFWVSVQEHPTKTSRSHPGYELVLHYYPAGLPEENQQELASIWDKYGRQGLKDCLTSVPAGQTYVLHRGALGEFSVGPSPPPPPPPSTPPSSPKFLVESSSDEESHAHHSCYCKF